MAEDKFFEWKIFLRLWDKLFRREGIERFLLAMDERIVMGEDAYQNRYPDFLSERLRGKIMMKFETLNKIYGHLQDEQSKNIFGHRLLYSISKEKSELDEMIMEEMAHYGQDDIVNRCLQWINDKDKLEAGVSVSIFGAGFAGRQILNVMHLHGRKISRFYDNAKGLWGQRIYGCRICDPADVGKEELIILGVNFFRDEILGQLEQMGVKREKIFIPNGLWWMGMYPQYFDKGFLFPSEHEVFIDGGALDGGDSLNFIHWCGGKYDAIYAFEPDRKNLGKLYEAAEGKSNFVICPMGLWNKEKILRFSSGNAGNCAVSDVGDTMIQVSSIDKILNGKPATYIKMDIEGSELEALKGAENTIRTYKPRLAICVYHKPEDIVKIPAYILRLNPDYKLYLRHYSYLDTETVLYAV